MESTLKMLQESSYVWAFSSIIAIVGFILAIFFGIKGNKYKRITYSKKTNKIVSLKNVGVKSLRLLFNEKEIEDISITRIAIWNSGNERINSGDIAESKPLRIGVKESGKETTEILDISIDYVTDDTIFKNEDLLKIEKCKDTYPIPFDYLAKSDGMIVQVIHTGNANNIYADCHLKDKIGIAEVNEKGLKELASTKQNLLFLLKRLIIATPISMIAGVALNNLLNYLIREEYIPKKVEMLYFPLFTIICIVIQQLLDLFSLYRIPKSIKNKI